MVKKRKLRPKSAVYIPPTACCPGHYLEEVRKSRERSQKSFSVSKFEEADLDFEFGKDYSTFERHEKDGKSQRRSLGRNLKNLLGVSFKFDKNLIKFNSAFGHYGRYTISTGTEPSVRDRLSLGSRNNNDPPAMRIKARFQAIDVLPLTNYNRLCDFLKDNYLPLCLKLEPLLGVRAKEDLATSLVRILHKQQLVKEFLCDLVMSEVDVLDNEHLMFRGNSLATKAMEAYMKLVATDYLKNTLEDYIKQVLDKNLDCEVDPTKLSSQSVLEKNRQNLMVFVQQAWERIYSKSHLFPVELREVFKALRDRLQEAGRPELADNLISSSIFLRFLCPAILSPSLFGLVGEYPTGQASRNLTLIAKTLQTLANFTQFGGKEGYMEFMNEFIEKERGHMHEFLVLISKLHSGSALTGGDCVILDLGKELSLIHSYLEEVWTTDVHDQVCKEKSSLNQLLGILKEIRMKYSRPTTPSSGSINTNGSPSDYENNGRNNNSGSRHSVSTNGSQRIQPAANLNTSDDYVLQSAVNDNMTLLNAGFHVQQNRSRISRKPPTSSAPPHGFMPPRHHLVERPAAINYEENYIQNNGNLNRFGFMKVEPPRCSNPIGQREYQIYDDRDQVNSMHIYDHVPVHRNIPGIRLKTGSELRLDSDSDESLEDRRPRRTKRRSESVVIGQVQVKGAGQSSGYNSQNNSNTSSPVENPVIIETPRALTINNPRYLSSSSSTSSGSSPPTCSGKASSSNSNIYEELGVQRRPSSPLFHNYNTSSSGVESGTATMRTTSSDSSQSSFERIPKMIPRMGTTTMPLTVMQRHSKPTVVNVDDEPPQLPERKLISTAVLTNDYGIRQSLESLSETERLQQELLKLQQENEILRQQLARQSIAH
ncbi:hypothetical protein FO519_002810 [Halicephalobus sp. NKZ332]|nr:hypothetical protein FO519_002810 [Halicephalobus sp. NKZ332]